MTTDPTAVLRDAETYLSALHNHVARHDQLGADFTCHGCQLREQITAVLAAAPTPPADQNLRDRIAKIRERHAVLAARTWEAIPHQHGADGCRCLSCDDDPTGWQADHPFALDCNELVADTPNDFGRKRGSCEMGPLLSYEEADGLAHAADDIAFLLAVLPAPADRTAVLQELVAKAEEWDGHITVQELRRMADEAQQAPGIRGLLEHGGIDTAGRDITVDGQIVDEAHQAGEQTVYPPVLRWRIELYDPLAEEWNPGSSLGKREDIVDRYEAITSRSPKWKDGTPVQRRIVRETTTYTIEPAN